MGRVGLDDGEWGEGGVGRPGAGGVWEERSGEGVLGGDFEMVGDGQGQEEWGGAEAALDVLSEGEGEGDFAFGWALAEVVPHVAKGGSGAAAEFGCERGPAGVPSKLQRFGGGDQFEGGEGDVWLGTQGNQETGFLEFVE